jgi:hypothetical protein
MEQEQAQEFHELEKKARLRLEMGVERPGYHRELQLLVLPSFDDCCSYELLASARNQAKAAIAIKSVWKKASDIQKFLSPLVRLKYGSRLEPTFEEVSFEMPEHEVSKLLSWANGIRVPTRVVNAPWGVDGTTYDLCFGSGFASSRFHWWSSPPNGWEQLQELVRRIQEIFNVI